MQRVLVIHRDLAAAAEIAGRLRDRGMEAYPYQVLGPRGFRELRAEPPDVILIDLRAMPSYGRVMGALVRESAALRSIPLVFLNGDPGKTALTRRTLPDAIFADWDAVGPAIARALECPSEAPLPPRPPVRTVAQKLGIEPGSRLARLNAPDDCRLDLPDGVRSVKDPGKADVILFWTRTEASLARELPKLASFLENGGKLWLLWPKKASDPATRLTMPRVRELANHHGMTDYKVCAVDATWSGMAVGKRRAARR